MSHGGYPGQMPTTAGFPGQASMPAYPQAGQQRAPMPSYPGHNTTAPLPSYPGHPNSNNYLPNYPPQPQQQSPISIAQYQPPPDQPEQSRASS